MTTKPLPDVNDPDFAPYFAACCERRLVVQRCGSCGRLRWPPRPACPACRSTEATWADVPTTGTLYSWVNCWRAGVPGFEDEIPYVVAVVEVEPAAHVRFLGNVRDARSEELAIGMRMTAEFVDIAEGVTLPYWRMAR